MLSDTLLAAALAAALGSPAPGSPGRDEVERPAIGERIGAVEFLDIRYLPRDLRDFGEKEAYVLAFTTTTCPISRRYAPRLVELEREFRDEGVQFLSVNVGAADSVMDVAEEAVELGIPFPTVKDVDLRTARAVGATRTPEVVVLDAERRLRYRGRVDDQVRFGGTRAGADRHDLAEALRDVLAGEEVDVPETRVDGCLITAPREEPVEEVTYAEHVRPILADRCTVCHTEGGLAPFTLETYDDASAQLAMIGEVVRQGRMPPWFASPEHGSFLNDRSLTGDERRRLLDWVRAGGPPGDLSDVEPIEPIAPLEPPADGSGLPAEPDLTIAMEEEVSIPAQGILPYQYVALPHVFEEDTWVRKVSILPSNPNVIHHVNLFRYKDGDVPGSNELFITVLLPGSGALDAGPGRAILIPAGSRLYLSIHYTATGRPEKSRVSAGLWFPRETVTKQLHQAAISNVDFEIPPGAPAHRLEEPGIRFDRDATGIAAFPHMHYRGRDITLTAEREGETRTLLMVPNYSFDWQLLYFWEPGTMKFPAGTRLDLVARFDNSAFNAYNPDPSQTLRFGPQSTDEMMSCHVYYTYDDEELALEVDPETGRLPSGGEGPPATR